MVLKKEKVGFFTLYVFTVFLFLYRMLFYLKDSANKDVELVLIWVIFFCSIGILLFGINIVQKINEYFFVKHKDRLLIIGYVFLIELSFLYYLKLEFAYIYLFSLLLIGSLFQAILVLLPIKIRTIMDYTLLSTYTLYAFGQHCYYQVFGDFFSFVEIGTLREGVESSKDMYQFHILHVLIVLLFIGFIYFFHKIEKSRRLKWYKTSYSRMIISLLLLFGLVNINAIYPVKSARMHLSDHYLYSSVFSKERFVSRYGLTNLFVRDVIDIITPSFTYAEDVELVESYLDEYQKQHNTNDYTGLFEGKNLVVILGESFDEIALHEELTPTLWELKTEGFDFVNHYTPVFPRTTCDTEIAINTSIIPSIEDGPTCYVYNDNSYSYSLPEMFNLNGYDTSAYHNNYKEFYTRDVVYEGFGYDSLFGQHELELSNQEKRYDSLFMQRSFEYNEIVQTPFLRYYLSLSGHSPYVETHLAVEKHIDLVEAYFGEDIPSEIKNYIATQIETDRMVEELLRQLENNGELENTVILFTNDHYPYTIKRSTYEGYTGIDESYQKNKSPLYIWTPGIEHEEIDLLSSSIDILPTLINMFSLGNEYNHYIGNDIFDTEHERIVYFKDYTILTEEGYFDLSEDENNLVELASDMYDLSKRIFRTDYYQN